MRGFFDDEAIPPSALPVTGGFVQGHGPGHLQAAHARETRTRIAASWPDSIDRAGPTRVTKADTPSPQTYPELASTDHINVDQVLGVETGNRPAQQPVSGWDGEMDAFMPDWARLTIW